MRLGLARKQRTCRRLRLLARSAPLGRSRWPLAPARLCLGARNRPLELARLRQGARNLSAWLLESIALADVFAVEPTRLHWGARHWRSRPLGSARASKSQLDPAAPETLHWAGPRMLASLNIETNILVHGRHRSAYKSKYTYLHM